MKKVTKVLRGKKMNDAAPTWFGPAMEKVMEKVNHVVPKWFAPALERALDQKLMDYPTTEEMNDAIERNIAGVMAPLVTRVEILSSFRTIIDVLEECATKDDLKKLELRLDEMLLALNNHEARILHLEEK